MKDEQLIEKYGEVAEILLNIKDDKLTHEKIEKILKKKDYTVYDDYEIYGIDIAANYNIPQFIFNSYIDFKRLGKDMAYNDENTFEGTFKIYTFNWL